MGAVGAVGVLVGVGESEEAIKGVAEEIIGDPETVVPAACRQSTVSWDAAWHYMCTLEERSRPMGVGEGTM